MMRFILGRGSHVNAERLKLQKELFQFNQTLFHGFPHRPSALAYDKKLNLLAIGTREGNLRVYGKPGVEFHALIDQERKIDSIIFIKNTPQFIVKCEDNSIHLFEIPNNITADVNSTELILVKSFEKFVVDLENDERTNSNRITTLTVHSSNSKILIATEDGTIHFLNTKKFELDENQSISLDKVQSQLSNESPKLLGAAERIIEHPLDQDRILIGYNRGQLVLWNLSNEKLEKLYSSGQQLEFVCWSSESGDEFISSHNDGSYIVWNLNDVQPSQQYKITYGPFPCKPINKIYGKSSENLIIFSGGMPRQLHDERHTVSIIQGINDSAKHQVLDLTSKIIDFVVLEQSRALIILAEEELVAIDLNDPEWSQFRLPYLSSVHSSPITFCEIYSDIPDSLIDKLKEVGLKQSVGKYSSRQWPVNGGFLKEKVYASNNVILITGHENGNVRIWNISDCAMDSLCTINTAKYFEAEDDIVPIDQDDQDDGDEWPPFKKVGIFDPYSDDPRTGIRKVVLCLKTFNLLVAGTAGQVILFELKDDSVQMHLTRETIDLVSGLDFIWKSHKCLLLENSLLTIEPGYHPKSIVQLNPPASVTALALNTERGLYSVGTTHGFAVFSYELNKSIAYKCTLNPTEVSNVNGSGNLITRKKSFRKSLRESFRKLRKGRSMRLTKKSGDKSSPVTSPAKSKNFKSEREGLESRPIERQVEAKTEDGIGSVVRYLYFIDAPIINQGQFQHTLWAGTNAGTVFIYLINDAKEQTNQHNLTNEIKTTTTNETTVDENNLDQNEQQNQTSTQASTSTTANEQKNNEIKEAAIDDKAATDLTCILTKEIQLKHHAPVIFIRIIDSTGQPIEEHQQTESGVIRVLIGSEEQFKLFNLPTLKPYCKFKLTAQEGAKSRRIHISKFVTKSDLNYSENCIVNITNQGDLGIFSILDLKKQLNSKCCKKEDVNGISNLVFANNGEGVYLNSPSEFSRFSLSTQRIVKPNCLISETNLEKIIIEVEENATNEPANQSDSSNNAPQLNQSINEITSTKQKQDDSSANHCETSANSTQKELYGSSDKINKLKNADNQTLLVKVTEVKTKTEEKIVEEKKLDNKLNNDKKTNESEEVVDNLIVNSTIPKIVEEHTEVKILETIRHDCSVKQLCSSPPKTEIVSEFKEKVTIEKQQNGNIKTSLVEVHNHNNGDLNKINLNGEHKNFISDLVDEDEGEGKSLEDDLLGLDKNEDNNLEKSNGTPTSGIIDDDDDSFLDTSDLNRTSPISSEDIKHFEIKNHKEQVVNNKKWYNLNETEIKEVESANNSTTIENSLNLTTNTGDITVDSIKEHFNNLSLKNDVDLLLDNKDDYN